MAERGQKGCQNTSDDGVNEILEGFVLTPKIDGVMDTDVWAGHSRFNCTCMYMYVYIHVGIPTYIHVCMYVVYVYVYVYIIYHCGCTALPTRRLDRLIFVVRKTRNPLQLWDAPCSFQRVIHFSCGVEDTPRFLSSRQKRHFFILSSPMRYGVDRPRP